MAQSIEIQKQRIKEFYRGKSAEDQKTTQSLYEYDENGNYVIYTTDRTSNKTIPPIKYRLATPEELQADDEAYASRVRKMKEEYAQKRAELFTESTKVSPNTKLLYKLNMELRNIDKKLISAQYVHNDIIEYDRFTTNIRMRNIFFENAVEDRKVEEDLVMIEAYRIPVQRGFVQESSTVSVPEANVLSADASPLEEQIRKTIRQTKAAAKSAAAVTVPPIVPKKISTAAAATVASAAAAKPAAPRSIVPIPKFSFKSVKSLSDAASTAALTAPTAAPSATPSAALTAPSAAPTASVVTPRSIVPMQRKKLPAVALSSVPEVPSATAAPTAPAAPAPTLTEEP